MELRHQFVVPASIDDTWAAFMDLESVAPCFPGAVIDSVDDDEFAGSVKVKLGPISMMYKGTGQFVERDESAHRAVIEAKGKDKRGNGTAGATIVAQMTSEGTGTAVEVVTDLSITGKPAQFGRGVIQDVSDKLLGQFVDCIAGKLGPQSTAADTDSPPAGSDSAGAGQRTSGDAGDRGVTSGEAGAAGGGAAGVGSDRANGGAAGRHTAQQAEAAELNLMAAVLPALLKRYALPAAIVIALVIVLRSRCRS